jgi:imidazolonepropionase-like amidohydrolase
VFVNDLICLEADRMIDGRGAAVEPARVVIQGERITDAGPVNRVTAPEGARRISLGARTLLPGLIDAHVHLKGWRSSNPDDVLITPHPLAALRAAADCRKLLYAGFTTVRDCGGCLGPHLRDAIAAKEIPGPRILTAYRGLSQTGRVKKVTWAVDITPLRQEVDGIDDCVRVVREHIGLGADLIKVSITGRVYAPQSDPGQTAYRTDEIKAIVDEAHRMGRRVAAHAEGLEGTRQALEAGADTIEHGLALHREPRLLDDMADRGVVLVPTLSTFHDLAERFVDDFASVLVEQAKRQLEEAMRTVDTARRAGVTIALGYDSGPPGTSAQELQRLIDAGLSTAEALRAATLGGAAALGREDLGRIGVGSRADVVVIDGRPDEDPGLLTRPEAIRLVVGRGVAIG